jgi:hypothetical protein
VFVRLAITVYVQALRAFPQRHRVTYGAEMIEALERELEIRRRNPGAVAAMSFVGAAVFNVIASGMGERRRYRVTGRNLIVEDGVPEIVRVAEMTATAFRVAGVDALRGRFLLPEDEREGAPDVMVIGHDAWLQCLKVLPSRSITASGSRRASTRLGSSREAGPSSTCSRDSRLVRRSRAPRPS